MFWRMFIFDLFLKFCIIALIASSLTIVTMGLSSLVEAIFGW